MRSHFFSTALASAAVLFCSAATAATPSPDTHASPKELVQAALAAEVTGDRELRDALLEQALAHDPEFAPARWQSGFVRVGDRWLSVEAAAAATRRSGTVARYRQLRDQVQGTAAAHLQLAKWCSDAGLKEQERVHLIYAMQFRPTQAEARRIRKILGLVRYQETLMPAVQAELMKEEAQRTRKALQEWKPRLSAIQRDLESRDRERRRGAVEQIRAIEGDASAVPLLESLLASTKPADTQTVIRSLAALPNQSATDALVRCALFANDEATRKSAADSLKSRSIFGYVPTLIGAFEPLVQVKLGFGYGFGGGDWHMLSLYQEGPTAARKFISYGGSRTDVIIRPAVRAAYSLYSPDQTVEMDSAIAQKESIANTHRQEVNQRVAMVLGIATGNDLGSDPEEWWSWWFDYNEVAPPSDKPVDEVVVNSNPIPITFRYMASCFPAGTPVETSIGSIAIELVRPGDCVLAQDPDKGELAYKPVLATTVRPPSPLINIRTARETIRATRGHPLWVSGLGWQMAKELKAGQWLHTTAGPIQIESAEEHGQAVCHNLVVADFNSFFVGASQLLVHDNNLRQVTTAAVPGLVAP
jgi:hypothetical protein